jgi:ABC-type Fe3+/spermidine/putrescine transport system ATPase subunit
MTAEAQLTRHSEGGAPMKEPAVEIRDLHLSYGGVIALNGIDLDVQPGEFIALLGPSGCGKTSLLRSVAGFAHPQRGTIRIGGVKVNHLPARSRKIGMVFQNYALFPHLTAAENISFGLRCRKIDREQAQASVRNMLEVVGLEAFADRRPSQLSGGQQQRVALARALVIQPEVLLLDEALGALDKKLRVQMQTELKALQRRFAIATIFVTHDQEEAMAMADRIVVLRSGETEQVDTPRELFLNPRTAWVAEFVGAGNVLRGRLYSNGATVRALEVAPGCDFRVEAAAGLSGPVTAFIRSDRIELTAARAGEPGLTVTSRRFLGSAVEVHASYQETVLRVLMPMEQAASFDVGQPVRAAAGAENCRIIAVNEQS